MIRKKNTRYFRSICFKPFKAFSLNIIIYYGIMIPHIFPVPGKEKVIFSNIRVFH